MAQVSPAESGELRFDRNRLNFSWLLTLRWGSVAGQLATILGVQWSLDVDLPLVPLLVIVGIEAASNLACVVWFRAGPAVAQWQLSGVMALDVALLTGLLYFTGGPFNPFSFLYLVQIALAAVVLHAHWTWMLVALSFGSFGLLLIHHRELAFTDRRDLFDIHQKGMWVALGVASAFIVHFLLRVTTALAARERELTEARAVSARQHRLASLATMAAGAAHELATPLGTIAVVAKELERHMEPHGTADQLDDVRLIREQVARCRVILDQMAGGVGESAGENIESVTVDELIAQAMTQVRGEPSVRVEVSPAARGVRLRLPPRAVAQALRSIITNAQDASPADREVVIEASVVEDHVCVEVRDRGSGMTPEVAKRIGEPFFTTKPPGRGMGLGLFLTRTVVETLGGALTIQSEPGIGTRVDVKLPATVGIAAAGGVS